MDDYKNNPLEYAQSLIDLGEKYYQEHSADIADALDHWQLQSDHMRARAAIPGRSAHYFPELHPAIFSRIAGFLDAFLQADPPISLIPFDSNIPGAEESTQRLEDYFTYAFKYKKFFREWFMAWLGAELFPYQAVFIGYEDKWGKVPMLGPNGKLAYDPQIIYSGMTVHAVPVECYRGDMYARSQEDMQFHARLKDVNEDYIRQGAAEGRYPYFDERQLDYIKTSSWVNGRKKDRVIADYASPKGYDIELAELFCKQYSPESGGEEIHIITFAGSMLLNVRRTNRSRSPYLILTSKPLPFEPVGLATARIGGKTQNLINELWNQRLDANEQSVWSPTIFKGDITSNPVWEPQALWQVSSDFEHSPLVKPNLSGSLVDDIRFAEERGQQALGSYDTIQAVTGGSKQTLGEYVSKQKGHGQILNVTLFNHGEAMIESIEIGIELMRENLPDWIELGLLGGHPAMQQLKMQDLAIQATPDIPKVKAIAMEEADIMKWQYLYDKLSQNPLIANNPMNMYELTHRLLQANDVKNNERIIGKREDIFNAVQAAPIPGGM